MRHAHQQVFSTGAWWDFDEVAPGLYERVYTMTDGYMDAIPQNEPEIVLETFAAMLREVTSDGSRKRHAGLKPPWWRDPNHEPAIYSHLSRWKRGELRDLDSGAHPLVHLAWRALAIAYQETCGQVDPVERKR